MTIAAEKLDADELLHLALRASEQGEHEQAITLLKRAADLSPKNGRICYMLGAEHAQIGLYDRAVQEMSTAVALEPDLHTASFQLGLLHLTSGRVAEADQAWKPLDGLGAENPLTLFKTGLLQLARDEFDLCLQNLRKGIANNTSNSALNKDMQRVISDVENRAGAKPAGSPTTPSGKKAPTPKHGVLSAYESNHGDDKD